MKWRGLADKPEPGSQPQHRERMENDGAPEAVIPDLVDALPSGMSRNKVAEQGGWVKGRTRTRDSRREADDGGELAATTNREWKTRRLSGCVRRGDAAGCPCGHWGRWNCGPDGAVNGHRDSWLDHQTPTLHSTADEWP